MPPHRLILKRYTSIIRLRNLDPTQGLCNGTRLIIRSVTRRLIDAEVATGSHAGNRVFIPRIGLLTPTDYGFPFILKRRQFPIRPTFCFTINKGQGQSLETIGISYLLLKPYLVLVNFMLLFAEFKTLEV